MLHGKNAYPPLALLVTLFAAYGVMVKAIERMLSKKAENAVRAMTFTWIVVVEFLFVFPMVIP